MEPALPKFKNSKIEVNRKQMQLRSKISQANMDLSRQEDIRRLQDKSFYRLNESGFISDDSPANTRQITNTISRLKK